MAADKITWEQFMFCNNDARGVRYGFEDLCRQLFVYEFLPENKTFRYVHSNPNNAGLESEPIYDEVNHRWIGYQVMWICGNESAKYWLGVLNENKNRGVKDIMIVSVDGLTGFGDASGAVFETFCLYPALASNEDTHYR